MKMLNVKLPIDTQFNQFSAKFSAAFNVPTPGEYDFSVTTNARVSMGKTVQGALYLIEAITVAGSVQREDYLEAVKVSAMPQIVFSLKSKGYPILPKPVFIPNYIDAQSWAAWFSAKQSDDELLGTVTGSLVQTAALVGVASVSLSVVLNCYEITDSQFIRMFEERSEEFFRSSQRVNV
ncbi:MAG TPA: hypothetical protein VLH56_19675 [Dissulfurispiraceae bacterium]|nr:hypothetical protein [Dissulfurispiraceae bacterium]